MKALDLDQIASKAEALAIEFLANSAAGAYHREMIERLAELAIYGEEQGVHAASEAIFGLLVERLADSFEPRGVALYNRVFAQLIQHCRQVEPDLDQELKGFGLGDESDLIQRAESLRPLSANGTEVPRPAACKSQVDLEKLNLAVVLSRVTVGADVAITSVIIEGLKRIVPNAEIVLAGGRRAAELFGGDRKVGFRELEYKRGGTLLERLMSWVDLLNTVRDLTTGLAPGEFQVIDPDSRLTQLGLLPVAGQVDYAFFPSREYLSESTLSLGPLASHWMRGVFGESGPALPTVSIKPDDLALGRRLARIVGGQDTRPVVTLNFGVGQNLGKRIGPEFEEAVTSFLIAEGAGIILDRGASEEEGARIDAVLAKISGGQPGDHVGGLRVIEVHETKASGIPLDQSGEADVLV
ncbi:MAG TPA: hypothetical protein VJX67_12965, partial [Blastocatellia bacterium]|nr:hypothetical protein [Blastocatellia bacterium]